MLHLHVKTKATKTHCYVSTQNTLAREHVTTQDTLADEYVLSIQGTQFSSVFASCGYLTYK